MVCKKVLLKNFFSLVSVQFANYILPLVTLPYLARVIGVEKFGLIAFAQAIVTYFVIITTFGFNLYAPREISIIRDDKEKTKATFWNIIYSQFALCFISFLILIVIIMISPSLRNEATLLLFTFGFVIGNILFPTWFFQGVEKMVYIAVMHLIIKIVYTVSIFIFIHRPDNYILVPLLFSVSQVIIGFIAIMIIIFHFGLTPTTVCYKKIFHTLKSSLVLFISNISINIYTKIHPILLGFMWGNVYVGYYSAAEKLFNAWILVQAQLSATLYPHISKMIQNEHRDRWIIFIRKSFIASLALAIPAAVICFILSKPIISLLFGTSFINSVFVLRIFSILFLIVGINYSLGMQTVLPLNMKKEFLLATGITGILSLIISMPIIFFYGYKGAALSYLLSELIQGILLYYFLRKKGIKIIDFNSSRIEAYE